MSCYIFGVDNGALTLHEMAGDTLRFTCDVTDERLVERLAEAMPTDIDQFDKPIMFSSSTDFPGEYGADGFNARQVVEDAHHLAIYGKLPATGS